MAASTYNRYNEPGAGFVEGFSSTRGMLQDLARDRGLADVEAQQVQQTDAGSPGSPGLADLGQNDAKSYGRDVVNENGVPVEQGSATGETTATPAVAPSYRLGGQVFDHKPTAQEIRDAKADARASVMRSNGAPDEANKDLAANSQLGLNDVQRRAGEQNIVTGAITQKQQALKLKADQRSDADATSEQEARDEVNDYIRNHQIDPKTISGQSDILAYQVAALTKRGLVDRATQVAKDGAQTVLAKTQATSAMRQELSLGVKQALDSGDMDALKTSLSKLDELLPNGGRVDKVEKRNGLIYVTKTDGNGVQTTADGIPPKLFQQHMDQMTGTTFDQQANAIVMERLKQAQVIASTNASNASAGASSASAKERDVVTQGAKYDLDRKKELDRIYSKDEKDRTPAEAAYIKGYSDKVDDSRAFRSGGANNERYQTTMDPTGNVIAKSADGKIYFQPRGKPGEWQDITPGAAKGAPAPAGAVNGLNASAASAGGAAPPAGLASAPTGFKYLGKVQ